MCMCVYMYTFWIIKAPVINSLQDFFYKLLLDINFKSWKEKKGVVF